METTGRQLTRKEMLKLSLLGTAALAIPLERAARSGLPEPLRRLPTPFRVELPIPRPLRPARSTATTDFYNLTMRRSTADIIPGLKTPIWGYNGQFPGPTIAVRKARRSVMTFTNELPEKTSVHMHGAYVDGDSDGHPNDLILPGRSKTYSFPNNQNARTMWYHDHAMHHTATNVYKGLAGFCLVGDDIDDAIPCPHGDFDIPLVIQDRLFDSDGGFLYPFGEDDHSTNGVEGDVVLVNGKPWPFLPVANRRYRFRILNGSNARVYQIALSNRQPLTVIGAEGGMFEKPVTVSSLPISPGERYEIVINFVDVPVGRGPENRVELLNLWDDGPKTTRRIMRFDVARRARDDSTVPDILRGPDDQVDDTHQPADPSEAVRTRRWVFERAGGFWTINGKIWDENRMDATLREGEVEIWEFINSGGGWIHPIHPHLLNFRVLSRNGAAPQPWDRGFKETVFLDGGDRVRVLFRVPKVPVEGTPGPFARRYPMHCHHIEHEDHDMMAQFQVLRSA